jgi:pimeloyl-ACP methyl ester carboxylesterase
MIRTRPHVAVAVVPGRLRLMAIAGIAAVVLAGCSSTPSPEPSQQPPDASQTPPSSFVPDLGSLEVVECPGAVLEGIGLPMACGYLTVPENRSAHESGSIRLFVTRTQPSKGSRVADDPVLLLGADLGWTPMYAVEVGWRPVEPGFALLPDRVGRDVINLDLRGVGLSEPNLFCGEVEALLQTDPGASTGDPDSRDALLDAVTACHDRLVADGVDLFAYNLAEMAADVEDLRQALGIATWNIETIGTSSAVAFELLRTAPDHARSVTMDSPAPPQLDIFTTALTGTMSAMARLDRACRQDAACSAAYPDVAGTLDAVLRRQRSSPSVVTDQWGSAVIGDAAILRLLTDGLSSEGPSIIPQAIYADPNPGGALDLILEDPVLGKGYTYSGGDAPNLVYGAFYSTTCRDQLPFVDVAALTGSTAEEPWYYDAYVASPYTEICAIWDVGLAPDDPHRPITSDVPVLAFAGRFDPHGIPDAVKAGMSGLSRASLIEVPYWGHEVLTDAPCPLEIRNAWIQDVTEPPDLSCVPGMDTITFVTD